MTDKIIGHITKAAAQATFAAKEIGNLAKIASPEQMARIREAEGLVKDARQLLAEAMDCLVNA